VMQNFRSARIGESNRHEVTVVSFTMADLRLTAIGSEQRFTVTEEELHQSFPADFDCSRGESRGFPFIDGPNDPGTTTIRPVAGSSLRLYSPAGTT